MSKIILLILLFFIGNLAAEKPIMEEVHVLYQNAALEEEACRELIELLAPYKTNHPLLLGYKASATMMMAKHVFNPVSKIKYFNKGKAMLENAIAAEPQNVELRLLRFLAQTNIPSFLGYNNNIQTDKKFILKSIPKIIDINLKKYIVSNVEGSKNLTEEEIKALKKKSKPLRH